MNKTEKSVRWFRLLLRVTASFALIAVLWLAFCHFGPAFAKLNFPEQVAKVGQWQGFAYMGVGFWFGMIICAVGIVASFWGGEFGWVLILAGLAAVGLLPLLWGPALVGLLGYWVVTGRLPEW